MDLVVIWFTWAWRGPVLPQALNSSRAFWVPWASRSPPPGWFLTKPVRLRIWALAWAEVRKKTPWTVPVRVRAMIFVCNLLFLAFVLGVGGGGLSLLEVLVVEKQCG